MNECCVCGLRLYPADNTRFELDARRGAYDVRHAVCNIAYHTLRAALAIGLGSQGWNNTWR